MSQHFDYGLISRLESEKTQEGFLRAWMTVSKVGDLIYLNQKKDVELDPSLVEGELRAEYVSKATLFDEKSLYSAWGKPITAAKHPSEMLDATNTRPVIVGMTMPKFDEQDAEKGYLTLLSVIFDAETIKAIEGGMRQVSAGYEAATKVSEAKLYQDGRYYNHYTVLPYGRAGDAVSVHHRADEWDSAIATITDADLRILNNIGEPVTQPAAIATEKKQSNKRHDEGGYMAQIKLDGADWELETPVIQAIRADQKSTAAEINQLQTKFDAKEDDACKLKTKLDASETQVEMLTGEVQGLKTKLEELTTSDEAIAAEVQARNDQWVDVLPSIKSVEPDFRIDSALTVPQIKRAYLKTVRKQDGVDGLSDAVIDGMYLALKPNTKQDAADKTRSHLDQLDNVDRTDGGGGVRSLEEARRKAAQRKEKAYMGGAE